MDARPSLGQEHGGTGSWHPAMRPDSSIYSNQEVVPVVRAQESSEKGITNEPRPTTDLSKGMEITERTILPEHPANFQGGNAESAEELQPSAHASDVEIRPQMNGFVRELGADQQGNGTIESIRPSNHASNPTFYISPLEKQYNDSTPDDGSEHQTQPNGGAHKIQDTNPAQGVDILKFQEEVNNTFTSGAELANSSDARKEMDNAFRNQLNLQATDQSSSVNRTNSFPQIPPLHESTVLPAQALPKSQAENIMEEEGEEEEEAFAQHPTSLSDIPTSAILDSAPQNDLDSVADVDNDGDFFAQMGGAAPGPGSPSPADEEARYEEGLPLVQAEQSEPLQDGAHIEPMSADDFYTELSQAGPADDDVGFFENAVPSVEESASFRPQHLDRKTTTQVLDSLHYVPHSLPHLAPQDNNGAKEIADTLHDDSQSAITSPGASEERPSLAHIAGGGIAVSLHTVRSQVLSEQHVDSETPEPNKDDLADLWAAALGDDELLDENEASLDPSTFFEDDGEGFLDEAAGQDGGQSQAISSPPLEAVYDSDGKMQGFGKAEQSPTSSSNRYVPTGAAQTQQTSSSGYQPSQFPVGPSPQPPHGVPGLRESASAPQGFGATAQQLHSYGNLAPPRPQMPDSTQSFADKSKGGYTSPYDLPMDVTRPKRQKHIQQSGPPNPATQNLASRPPPPRSSSMFTMPSHSETQPTLLNAPTADSTPPASIARPPTMKAKPSTGNFFEELAPAPKPRPSTSAGKYTPPISQQTSPPPPSTAPQPELNRQLPVDQHLQDPSPPVAQAYQLVPPERMSLFGTSPPQQLPSPAVPALKTRYSPAPPKPSSVPPPQGRYASTPISGSQPPQVLPFQPRTSSPLAQNPSLSRQSTYNADQTQYRPGSDSQQQPIISRPIAPNPPFPTYQRQPSTGPSPEQFRGTSPPLANSRYAPFSDSPSSSSQAINTPSTDRDVPLNQQNSYEPLSIEFSGGQQRVPPQRSQTQSPGTAKSLQDISLNHQTPYQRPASVSDRKISIQAHVANPVMPQQTARARGLSQNISYIRPIDGRELDPLERWKGGPIVAFGFGGNVVTSFSQQVPRYAAGQKTPMIKCSPGEVKIQSGKFFALEESTATFPGPLKSKSKKKEVLDWLQKRVADLESNPVPATNSGILPDPSQCHEEKILLWKTVKVLVEHDGIIDGNQAAETAVRAILSPEITQGDAVPSPLTSVNTSSSGISRRAGSTNLSATTNQDAMEDLRKILLNGDREKAVWHAVDNLMWAHAMLISSTLDKDIWKQVSAEFVKQEVKAFGDNTESLAALYQIFSGNGEESIDELVPPSARAGLQMVSKAAGAGPTKNALDGLDRWRETLTLILSNRTPDDGRALVSLGQLLAGYGRTEAAHISYIFAKSPGLFGGPDDPQVSVALLGADHLRQPFDYGRDMDSILLTEVYDFARTVLASSSAATVSPHLQSFKLYHAMVLAEYGHKSEAQQYCDAITSALKSTTKPSPYYHAPLFGALENLTDRLRQAPKDGSNSWISKPSIDKVSGSIWAKFNSYVAGDDSDAASTGSGLPHESEAGPFARVAGDSPVLSRSPSMGDLYNPSGLGLAPAPAPMPSNMNSRYAPAGVYSPRSPQEQARQPSQDHQRPLASDTLRPSYAPQQFASRPVSSSGSMNEPQRSQYQPTSYAPQSDSYLPTPPSQPEYMPEPPPEEPLYQQPPQPPAPHLEAAQPEEQSHSSLSAQRSNPYGPPSGYEPKFPSYEPPPTSSYEPSSYEPPASGSYEPPSYNPSSYDPDIPQMEDSPVQLKSKKPMIDGDGDDDFEARAAAMRKEERARKDREADEAMRKAAEEDAKKDNPKLNSKKSGWFGSWLGGAKDKQESMQQQGNAPIKVKLGEESSFYFDKEKGKWVNKKAGPEDEKASAPPPPPPRGGPPSRATSGTGPPPPMTSTPPVPPIPTGMPTPPISLTRPPLSSIPSSNYASRSGTPAVDGGDILAAPTSNPVPASGPTSSGPPSGPSSAPPSRPATSQSGGSSIDDLIGAPQQRKGGTVRNKGKKGRGYVDVMAK